MPRALPRHRGLPACWLAVVLVLSVSAPSGGLGEQQLEMGSPDGGGGGISHDDAWMAVHDEISLDGLWGSIDTDRDRDPYVLREADDEVVHLFWSSWDGAHQRVVHAWRPEGGAWAGPRVVDPSLEEEGGEFTPRAVIGADGLIYLAWSWMTPGVSQIRHSLWTGGGWTQAAVLSGADHAAEPFLRTQVDRTLVSYQTPTEAVTVEVIVVGYSGGSDDIDPTLLEIYRVELERALLP